MVLARGCENSILYIYAAQRAGRKQCVNPNGLLAKRLSALVQTQRKGWQGSIGRQARRG